MIYMYKQNIISRLVQQFIYFFLFLIQAAFDDMKRTYDKKLYDLACELDEEKKLRQNAVVDMERIKKLMGPK